MRIKVKRHDAYREADIEVEMVVSARRPMEHVYFRISATGDERCRALLRDDLVQWSKDRRLGLESRCQPSLDRYAAYLRSWAQVAEFMAHWIGEENLSTMLEGASVIASKHDNDINLIRQQLAELRATQEAQDKRLRAAARAFLELDGEEVGMRITFLSYLLTV